VKNVLLKLNAKRQVLYKALKNEHGQDLVEYAAIITVVILGLIVGMRTLANGINNAMEGAATAINAQVG
jgi:Flp pilus assembly pilin Flp